MKIMNWYKKAQQGLLFYPWSKDPESATERISPIRTDPQTGEKYYKCSICGKLVSEDEIAKWYKSQEGIKQEYNFPYELTPAMIESFVSEQAVSLLTDSIGKKVSDCIPKENPDQT